jgi:hypothetical protein
LFAVLSELIKGFHYLAWLPALFGIAWGWKRLHRRPEAWLIALVCLVHAFILWRLTMVAGYVSERHVLLLVLAGCFPAVTGLREMPGRLARWRAQISLGSSRTPQQVPVWSLVLLLGMAGICLPKTLQPIHPDRVGHRMAGLWLASQAGLHDVILDGHFGWAHFYAGRLSARDRPPAAGPGRWTTYYVVKGRSRERPNAYGPTNAVADVTVAQIKALGGKIVYRWPEQAPAARADVVVWKYRRPNVPTRALVNGQ